MDVVGADEDDRFRLDRDGQATPAEIEARLELGDSAPSSQRPHRDAPLKLGRRKEIIAVQGTSDVPDSVFGCAGIVHGVAANQTRKTRATSA